MPIEQRIKDEFIRLASSSRTRTSVFSNEMPTEWQPHQVIDPRSGLPFTDVGAWTFVVAILQQMSCNEVVAIELRKPLGKIGYVLKPPGGPNRSDIYIKLQLWSGRVIGRSFHYSRGEAD